MTKSIEDARDRLRVEYDRELGSCLFRSQTSAYWMIVHKQLNTYNILDVLQHLENT